MKKSLIAGISLLAAASLASAAEIHGTLSDGGKPVPAGVALQLECGGASAGGKTDDFGSYSLKIAGTGECKLTVDYQGGDRRRSASRCTTSRAATTSRSRRTAASSSCRENEMREPAPPAPDRRDAWDKAAIVLQPVGGLLTALAVAVLGFWTSSWLRDREARESALRERMQTSETNARLYSELHQQARGVRERPAQGHVHVDHQLLSRRRRRQPRAEGPEPRAPRLQLPRVPQPEAAVPPSRPCGPREPAARGIPRAPRPRRRGGFEEADARHRGGRRELRRLGGRQGARARRPRRRVATVPYVARDLVGRRHQRATSSSRSSTSTGPTSRCSCVSPCARRSRPAPRRSRPSSGSATSTSR